MIEPHGKHLINRIPGAEERVSFLEYALFLHKITVDAVTASDLELIGTGAFSPLTGFLRRDDYRTVLHDLHLADRTPWTIPVTLPVSKEERAGLSEGQNVALRNSTGEDIAILSIEEIYPQERNAEAQLLFGSNELTHPGVLALHQRGDYLLAGPIVYIGGRKRSAPFFDYYLTPYETRSSFHELGWNNIVAFELKDPNSRLHKSILHLADNSDGLFIHPIAGSADKNDLPAEIKLRCYEILLQTFFSPHRTFLSALPAEWRYAGEREAVHHAIIHKNYGATHVVFDSELYGSRSSIENIFKLIGSEIGVKPLFLEDARRGAAIAC